MRDWGSGGRRNCDPDLVYERRINVLKNIKDENYAVKIIILPHL